MKESKRPLDVVVISDVHLGTIGCHARELLRYLKSIDAKTIILNGDIIDAWQFRKSYWPKSHMKVIKFLVSEISKGKNVYYITGNHDEVLRRFSGFELGSFKIVNKVVLNLDGTKAWIFHGDVFDITMKHSKILAKLGATGYDLLILLNRLANFIALRILKKGKLSLSKKIKNSVKSAIKYIDDFEETAIEIAASKGFDYVICGHIHQPAIRHEKKHGHLLTYLNSGDWIENLTSLEYQNGQWTIFKHEHAATEENAEDNSFQEYPSPKELFNNLLTDIQQAS